MQTKLLTFGYKINKIEDLPELSFSNFSLNYSTANRWSKKLSSISKMIENDELQCILFVVNDQFVSEFLDLKKNDLQDLINTCKKTHCIVAVQEYLLKKQPLYFDYNQEKYVNIEEIRALISELQKEGNNHPLREKLLAERKVQFISEDVEGNPIIPKDLFEFDSLTNRYQKKLELLENTKKNLPKAKRVISFLESNFEEIITFRHHFQLTDRVGKEINELFSNEILNIYIPKQYSYTNEFQDFINLFEKYLKTVEELNFQIVVNETQNGTNYKFISFDKPESIEDLPNKFHRFSTFMDLCENEPENAIKLLDVKNISPENAISIIQRLSKKYKRLLLDIQQQKERLELSYKQDLQNELFEGTFVDTPFSLVEQNFSSKAFENIYELNEDDKQIIKIFEKYAPDVEVNHIQSNLGLIKDPNIAFKEKEKSSYKIKKILLKIMRKGLKQAEQIMIEAAVRYINSKIE